MKFSLVFLGLVAVAIAAPRRDGHATLAHIPDGRDVHLPDGRDVHLPDGRDVHLPDGRDVHLPDGRDIHLPDGRDLHLPDGRDVHLPDGRDIQNVDMARRSDSSQIHVVRANTDSIKRSLGENIEARQAGEVAEAAAEIVGDVVDIVEGIVDAVQADNSKRGQFTTDTVTQEGQKFPGYNWVICHVDHTTAFDGTQGTDWGHSHVELGMTIGTVGFELYWFKSGTFTRNGDGGFLNWAYEGVVTGTDNGGSVVHFAAP